MILVFFVGQTFRFAYVFRKAEALPYIFLLDKSSNYIFHAQFPLPSTSRKAFIGLWERVRERGYLLSVAKEIRMKDKKNIYRIIDANLNRAREGLRVVEEVARFIWEDEKLSKILKNLRHELTKISQENFDQKMLLQCRDSENDLGAKGMGLHEGKRKDVKAIVQANLRRTEEALRVLEEFGKIIKKGSAEQFKKLRFKLYTLEKIILGSSKE